MPTPTFPLRIPRRAMLAIASAAVPAAAFIATGSITRLFAADSRPHASHVSGSSTDDVQQRISDAIEQLGSDAFPIREKAAQTVWQFGEAAVPALKEGATSGNPEIARRCRSILSNFAYGIRPDTAPQVIDQLNAYRRGNNEEKRAALAELSRQGAAGGRVLAKIARDETDPDLKQMAMNGATVLARPTAATMIRQGEFEMAESVLSLVAYQDEAPARDLAAFQLLHGGLDHAIEQLRKPSQEPTIAAAELKLACALRAKGDLAGATKAATAAGDNALAESIRVELGDYAGLAKDIEARGVNESSIEEMGFVMAYHRLAGHKDDVDRWAKKIIEFGRTHSSNQNDAVEALFLNERPQEAIDLLVELHNPLLAMEYVGPRFDFKLNDQLVDKTREDQSGDLAKVLAKSCPLLHHQGRTREAIERLMAVSRGENGPVDADCWAEILEAAPLSGISIEQVDVWLAQAMTTTQRPGGQSERLFRKARYLDPVHAMTWWDVLRDHRMALTGQEITALIRRIDRSTINETEFNALIARVKEFADHLPRSEQVRRLSLVADTLTAREHPEEALKIYQSLLPPPEGNNDAFPILMSIGDLHAKAKRWSQAADAYADASKLDLSDARPVALEGWAQTQAGKIEEGKRLMELAHLMPLGDEQARADLAGALEEHGVTADAHRERELAVKLGSPRGWAYGDSLRRLAGDVNNSDPLTAAAMWDRAFLANLTTQMTFVDPTANLSIPVLVRRTKAIGRIRAGKIAEAMEDAKFCLDADPADADSQIAIIRELDKAGKKQEAEAVYRRAFDCYDNVRKQYPQSSQANNLVAWLLACVKRDLDHALVCAKKGIELEPKNTAILDTLSEVYFARGEYDLALSINEQCRTLEPFVDHHKKNLARFTAAKQGKKVEGAPVGEEE